MQIHVACDNVGGLGEHVTCHTFWFLSRPFFLSFFVYSWDRAAPSHVNRFLTIYTSYDVIPRKDVPFMGLFVAIPHLGDQICQNPQFFKRSVQDIEICILSKLLHQFQPILHNTKDLQTLIMGGPNTAQQIQDGGRPPF